MLWAYVGSSRISVSDADYNVMLRGCQRFARFRYAKPRVFKQIWKYCSTSRDVHRNELDGHHHSRRSPFDGTLLAQSERGDCSAHSPSAVMMVRPVARIVITRVVVSTLS